MTKRILLVFYRDQTNKGGAEEILRMIYQYMKNQGYEAHVFFFEHRQYGDWDEPGNDKLHLYYPIRTILLLRVIFLFWNFLKVRRLIFDYSFTSHLRFNAFVGVARKLGILKINKAIGRESDCAFLVHKGISLQVLKFLYDIGYPSLDILICQTEKMKKQMTDNLKWLSEKTEVKVIPNPINQDNINKLQKEIITDIVNLNPYIVTAGSLIPIKGYDLLIKAFEKISTKYKKMKLVILGEGPQKENLLQLSQNLNLEDRVVLYGRVTNVYPFFRNAEACVISSIEEGFPNVLLQMMSQNERVASTLCAGGIDKIQGLSTCIPSDIEKLAEAIDNCLQKDSSNVRSQFDRELARRELNSFMHQIL